MIDYDDRVLDARDMAEEIAEAREAFEQPVTRPRQFSDVANEWLEAVLAENSKTGISTDALLLIMRLGVLGQRLIYEANAIGMRDTVGMIARE